jgi:glutathione S-transferase
VLRGHAVYRRIMLKLIVGNKAYSSWSLRGWLAVKQSGLPFEEVVLPLYDDAWAERRTQPDMAPSAGKVPLLWDDGIAVWESTAIIDYLADKVGRDRFWPADDAARGYARAIAAEMHAGFVALRRECPTNFRRRYPAKAIGGEAQANVDRALALWHHALDRFGGPDGFLFGPFGAADIMYAPLVTRLLTYALPIPGWATAYCERIMAQPFLTEWMAAAAAEPWVIEQFEAPAAG